MASGSGVTKDWVVRIVKLVGNYGEVYDRNVASRLQARDQPRPQPALDQGRHPICAADPVGRQARGCPTGLLIREAGRDRLSACAGGGDRLARLRACAQRAGQSAGALDRQRFRLPAEQCGLRHQPYADPLQRGRTYGRVFLVGLAQYGVGGGLGICWRRCSASPSASRGFPRTGWWHDLPVLCRGDPQSCRCCSNSCSGTSPCWARCRRRVRAARLLGAVFLNNRGLMVPGAASARRVRSRSRRAGRGRGRVRSGWRLGEAPARQPRAAVPLVVAGLACWSACRWRPSWPRACR